MEHGGNAELKGELQVVEGEAVERRTSTFDIDSEFNREDNNYEDERLKHKLCYWKSALLFIQSAAGISLFTLQKPLQMVGLYGGFFITILVGYITCFGLVTLSALASDIEKDFGYKRRVKNFYELTNHIQGKHIPIMRWLMMVSGVCMMYASTISNVILVADTLEHHLGISVWISKLSMFVLCSLIFFLLIEPEKIKFINIYMTALLFALTWFILLRNLISWAQGNGPKFSEIKKFDWKNIGVWGGNLSYAFEVASNFLSLRLTSATEVNYEGLTQWMMAFVGLNYYGCAAAHIVGNPESEISENSFQMMAKHGDVWKLLIYLFMINTMYTFTFNTIFTSEIIENIPFIHDIITNKTGVISRPKITALRIFLWGIGVGLSFLTTDIIKILNVSGSVFSPIISYFGPLVLTYAYMNQKGQALPCWKRVHNFIYLKFAFTISIWGIVNAIQN